MAKAASLISLGIIFIVSSVDLMIIGSIMIERAKLPAKAENPFVICFTTHRYEIIPRTIDGTP